MPIGNARKDGITQTSSSTVFVLRPEIADWSTLKQKEEKVHGAEDQNEGDIDIDDCFLVSLVRESQIEGSN